MATLLLAGCVGYATPAAATTAGLLDATCTPPSSAVSTYNPPLTSAQQVSAATISYQLGPCVSVSQPGLTSGTADVSNPPRQRSCLDLLSSGSTTIVVTWNTGQKSTLSLHFSTTVAGAVLEVLQTGTVTSGLFQGDTVVLDQTGPAANVLLCTAGLGSVPSIDSLVTLEITSV
ncbi:hypothetical protein ACFV3R_22765 [Streptomyces sp. NPDC059740]|uniref:hypothetical protein n=1 Tax=Streptomyces sp. NPDC059740 TaxID=3346926 RepID=UPI00365E0AD5